MGAARLAPPMRREAVALACAVGLALVGAAPALAGGPAGEETVHEASTGELSREYRLYAPAGAGPDAPLVVMLHGCGQDAEAFRDATGISELADEHGFLVAYPEQDAEANPSRCWNWFEPTHHTRGQGEAAVLAQVVHDVDAAHGIDGDRVYAAGLSAGAAMSAVLGATYPDVFDAVSVHAGLPYKAAEDGASAALAMALAHGPDPSTLGEGAFEAGPHEDPTRVMVVHGDADTVVHPDNAARVVGQWARTNTLAGAPMDAEPERSFTRTPVGELASTVDCYEDADGSLLVEQWTVHGMHHAWSGGSAERAHTQPLGPDASAGVWSFFSEGAAAC